MIQRELIFGVYHVATLYRDNQDFEKLYQRVYRPILTLLYDFPKIRTTLYIPGDLILWFEKFRPEVSMLFVELSKRRQLEFLTGGRHDPYLALLAPKDRVGQVELLTTMVRRHYKTRTRGIYLAGQLWSNTLIQSLDSCGVGYTFIDDSPIQKFVHHSKRGALMPFRVENQGKFITIFPIHRSLCNDFYRGDVDSLFSSISRTYPQQPVTLFLDSKKLGELDNLHQVIRDLFERVSNESQLKTIIPREYIRNNSTIPRAYLPEGWYDNSTDWKFPQDAIIQTPETSAFYGKMQLVHNLVGRPKQDKSRKKSATCLLYKAQNYSFYATPDNEDGLESREVRHMGHSLLIEAEKMLRGSTPITKFSRVDMNHDGVSEYYYRGVTFNTHIDEYGASVCSLEYLPRPWNYGATYGKGTIDNGHSHIKGMLRRSFVDFFLPKSGVVTQEHLFAGKISGVACTGGLPFEVKDIDRDAGKIRLATDITLPRDTTSNIELEKEFRFLEPGGVVTYQIKNNSLQTKDIYLAVEFNFAFSSPGDHSFEVIPISPENPIDCYINGFLCNDYNNSACISVTSREQGTLWFRDAVDQNGYYQYTTIYLQWHIVLDSGEVWTNPLGFMVENLLKSQKSSEVLPCTSI